MATKKKMLQAAAGNAGGSGVLNVEDVFSTYLYDGTSAEQTITNGIDLAGEGGMIWGKIRSSLDQHWLVDSERGTGSNNNYKYLMSNLTNAESDFASRSVSSFNSNGFTLQNGTDKQFNESGQDYASWTFRKAPKFFDVVTYTGTGSAQNISHSLGSVPGMILTCNTGSDADWGVYHRQLNNGTDRGHWRIKFNSTGAQVDQSNFWNDTAPTDSVFTVGTNASTNATNNTYVAYLFAHNDGDGGFGADSDLDIIKCGSYTGNGSSDGPEIDLGFEPQWMLVKMSSASGNDWIIQDTTRGFDNSPSIKQLYPNLSNAESNVTASQMNVTPTGFKVTATGSNYNASGYTYIYMAIRRGTKVPESATEVFDVALGTGTYTHTTGFPVDLAIQASRASTIIHRPYDRLRGGGFYLETSDSTAEANGGTAEFDNNTGYTNYGAALNTVDFMWKRAPGFCDVVAYSGDGVAGRTVSHNLGVAPEMMWVKRRTNNGSGDGDAQGWAVWHKDLGDANILYLERTDAVLNYANDAYYPSYSTLTGNIPESQFDLGNLSQGVGWTNSASETYIAYLFASLDGISKVGSYTGNGGSQTIDCGFSAGARFILIKRTDYLGDWWVLDTARGIVAGNDALLNLNTTSAEVTSVDVIDPNSSGFTVDTTNGDFNNSGANYIFYAIA